MKITRMPTIDWMDSMMNEIVGLNNSSFNRINQAFRSTTEVCKYPPYDLYAEDVPVYCEDGSAKSEWHTFIRMALAGIPKDSIRVSIKDDVLEVRNVKPDQESEKREYIHRGIAQREFRFVKTLPDTLEFVRCTHKDGCLLIEFKPKAIVEPKEEFIPIE